MAIWQVELYFIPVSWVEKREFDISPLDLRKNLDVNSAWGDAQPDPSFKYVFSKIFRPTKAWDKNLLIWGNKQGNDIQVWYKGERVSSIVARLDFRYDFNVLVIKLVKAARLLNCVLYFPECDNMVESNEFKVSKAAETAELLRELQINQAIKTDLDLTD